MMIINEFIPIPKEFWSFETGAPFNHCALCEKKLLTENTNYLIEKALQDGEVIFEYAVCTDCQRTLHNNLSTESRQRIKAYFSEHIDLEERRLKMLEAHGMDHRPWMDHCAVKGYPIRECHEVQIYAHCLGDSMGFTGMPYALCGEVMDDILELISPESRGTIDHLQDQLFDLDLPQGFLVL